MCPYVAGLRMNMEDRAQAGGNIGHWTAIAAKITQIQEKKLVFLRFQEVVVLQPVGQFFIVRRVVCHEPFCCCNVCRAQCIGRRARWVFGDNVSFDLNFTLRTAVFVGALRSGRV